VQALMRSRSPTRARQHRKDLLHWHRWRWLSDAKWRLVKTEMGAGGG
jgi:hypothetical protein